MSCNKEEAEKAKAKAEEKFKAKDYEGAKRMALKAQSMDASLPCLRQILAAYDVHIAAASKKNGRIDWHAVLGVEPCADFETIQNQYKKLRFLTHPDKNPSVAADGAFKLVVRAWETLSTSSMRNGTDEHPAGNSSASSTSSSSFNKPNYSKASSGRPDNSSANSASSSSYNNKPSSKASSGGSALCPRCDVRCKYLDSDRTVIRCSNCDLFAFRDHEQEGSSSFGVIIESGDTITVHGVSGLSIFVETAENVNVTGDGGRIYIDGWDYVHVRGCESIFINKCKDSSDA
ncbi:DnaJ domain-containing protein [Dioscorea alata]|uniref:DnaJ domain-containing protein n=1 Tax=Dioscorea alata TaxID=55571 RepID=A0ACB7VP01_DIOAL|nr:DnaJ domain-containing protein [Dioscorea alata]